MTMNEQHISFQDETLSQTISSKLAISEPNFDDLSSCSSSSWSSVASTRRHHDDAGSDCSIRRPMKSCNRVTRRRQEPSQQHSRPIRRLQRISLLTVDTSLEGLPSLGEEDAERKTYIVPPAPRNGNVTTMATMTTITTTAAATTQGVPGFPDFPDQWLKEYDVDDDDVGGGSSSWMTRRRLGSSQVDSSRDMTTPSSGSSAASTTAATTTRIINRKQRAESIQRAHQGVVLRRLRRQAVNIAGLKKVPSSRIMTVSNHVLPCLSQHYNNNNIDNSSTITKAAKTVHKIQRRSKNVLLQVQQHQRQIVALRKSLSGLSCT